MARKKKPPEPPADTTRWLGTYGDMVTLLMAFFVMLFAVSDTNVQKFEAFIAGLAGPFDNPSVELGLVQGTRLEAGDASPIEMLAPVPPGPADIQSVEQPIDSGSGAEGATTGRGGGDGEAEQQLGQIEQQLDTALADLDLPISADIRDDERGLVVSISTDDVLFDTGSARLSEVGQTLLAEIAPILAAAPNTVVVEGHTDNQPLSRAGYTNWNLSTDRAVAVVQLLGDAHGLPFDRVSAAGYAEHRPLVPNDSAANRATNRRVEILVVALDVAHGPPAAPGTGGSVEDFSEELPDPVDAPVVDFSEELPDLREPTTIASILGAAPLTSPTAP